MKIAYFTSNRTTIPPHSNQIAASTVVTMNIINNLAPKHDITLFAAKGSSMPKVKIEDLGLDPTEVDSSVLSNDWVTKAVIGMKQIYIGEVLKHASEFDIIHIQTEPIYIGMPFIHLVNTPILFTIHNAYHSFEENIFRTYTGKVYLSGLSKSQMSQIPGFSNAPVIYNGIEPNDFPYLESNEDYFLFIGRLTKEKGIDAFLHLAETDPAHMYYICGKGDSHYESLLLDMMNKFKNIKFLGMLSEQKKIDIISKAKAVILPLQWEEPFGLVVIESMAAGVPVIAYARGSIPEIVKDGVTGFIINNSDKDKRGKWLIQKVGEQGLIEAINILTSMPNETYKKMRNEAKKHVLEQFTAERMAYNYEDLYKKIINDFKTK